MTESLSGANSNFGNVNLNVDGKKKSIRLEKGVTLQGVSIHNSGKLFKTDVKYNYEYDAKTGGYVNSDLSTPYSNVEYDCMYSRKEVKEIKLTEAEYAMLKNIADNDGDSGTLSQSDLTTAFDKYMNSEFSNDIKNGLPKGYSIERGMQDRDGDYRLRATASKNDSHETLEIWRESEHNTFDAFLEERLDESIDGKAYGASHGDGEAELGYLGKDNKFYTYYTYGIYDNEKYSTAYKDKDGTLITEYQNGSKSMNFTTKDGKKVHEHYSEDSILKYKEVSYKNAENEDVYEFHQENRLTVYTGKAPNYTSGDLDNYTSMLIESYKDGKLVQRNFHDDNTSSGNVSSETYDENGNVTGRWYKQGDVANEQYDANGNVTKRVYAPHVQPYDMENYEYSKDGKLEKVKIHVPRLEKGKTVWKECAFDAEHNLLEVDGFKVKDALNSKVLSKNAEKYRSEFLNMSAEDIAHRMYEQISGPSMNEKTLDMFDAIPEEKLMDVLESYNNIKVAFGKDQDSMLIALADEWGIGQEELLPRMNYVYAVYLNSKKDDLNADDITVKDNILKNNDESYSFRVNLAKVEEYVTGIDSKYEYGYKQAPKLKNGWF